MWKGGMASCRTVTFMYPDRMKYHKYTVTVRRFQDQEVTFIVDANVPLNKFPRIAAAQAYANNWTREDYRILELPEPILVAVEEVGDDAS